MKKLLFATLILLLILGLLTGCGARRQAMTATAMAQALTATAMAQPPVATAPAMAQPPVVTAPAVSTPATSGVILFQDDFQDGQPDGWQITTAWYVQQEGNVYYFSASGQGGAWVPQGGNWADYEFQAAVRVTTGGVVLNYRMTGEGRYLLHFREDGLYLTKEHPKGSYTTLTQTAAPSLNAWHQVAVAGYGGHLQVYVDRTLQLDYTDPSPLLRGTIGMTTKEGYQTAVDDVLVTRLTAALPTAMPMALPPTVAPPAAPLPAEAGLPLEEVPPPEEAPLPSAAGLPVIDYFRSEPSERAGCYYLHWDLHEASAAYLNGEGVIAPDSREVCPEETATYTLRAENEVGSVEETVTIEVGGAPPPPPAAGQPDLEIGEVSVWVPLPTDPKRVAVTIEVRNVGSGPAGAFTVRWYPHQASGEVGCSLDVAGLGAGVGQILDDCPSYTYAQGGEMHWRAIVDEDNEIQNDPKGNNEARGTVRIEAGGGGQQPPAAPTNLRVTSTTKATVRLAWNDNSNNEDGFEISVPGGLSSMVRPNETQREISALGCGQTYNFRVRAFNAAGNSGWSNEVTAQTLACDGGLQPPAAPSDLRQAAIALVGKVALEWNDNSNNEDGFDVERVAADGSATRIATANANATGVNVDAPPCGVTYQFQVSARNAAGYSAASNRISVQGPTCPGGFAVTNVTARVAPTDYAGACPKDIVFSGVIMANGAGTVRYRWDRGSGPGPEHEITFAAAGSKTVTDELHGGVSGTYTAKLHILAPNDMVSNQAASTLTCGKPDLVARKPTLSPSTVVHGAHDLNVTFDVVNQGNAQAGASKARWYTAGEGLSFTCDVPALAPGASHHCSWMFPNVPLDPGKTYGTWAVADSEHAVAESNEDNNRSESAPLKVK